jgi:hypothetical protein
MSRSTDKLVDVYFSPEATALKQKSWAAGKIAIVSAVAFVVGFGICISLIFTSILGINPLPGFATVLLIAMFGVVTLVAIPTCWVFTIRGIYLRFKVQSLVSERMSIGEA